MISKSRLLSKSPQLVQKSTSSVRSLPIGATATLRWKSSAAETSLRVDSNKDATSFPQIELKHVPKLPLVGSFAFPSYRMNNEKVFDYFPSLRKKYGDFYTLGFPLMGAGINKTVHVLTDPDEMLKLLRNESSYPYGAIQGNFLLHLWLQANNSPIISGEVGAEGQDELGFFGQGQTWKRLRTFLQTDMLSPVAAKGYVPGIIEAAQLASAGAPASADDVLMFTTRSSFDMFSTMMLGELTETANVETPCTEQNESFANNTLTGLTDIAELFFLPHQLLMARIGIQSELFRKFTSMLDTSREIALSKIAAFAERKKQGKLNEKERASYLSHAIDRQAKDGVVTHEELADLCMFSLIAALDTTSGVLSWCLLHLALNPEVQQRLRSDLQQSIATNSENGVLSEEALTKKAVPYLHAIIRENHRLTPPIPFSVVKHNTLSDLEIHGVSIPKGNAFMLDAYSPGVDQDLVPDTRSFQPERFLDEAVKARQDTPAAILDHPLYKGPFSHGARRCPGSRIANYETLVFLSQMVLDWEISLQDKSIQHYDEVPYLMSAVVRPELPGFEFKSMRE